MSSPPPLEPILGEASEGAAAFESVAAPLPKPLPLRSVTASGAHAQRTTSCNGWQSSDDDGGDASEEDDVESSGVDAEDVERIGCLFCSAQLPTMTEFDAHTQDQHQGFCLRHYQRQRGLNFYSTIQLVNYCRLQMRFGQESAASLLVRLSAADGQDAFLDDAYLRPVLQDDALLMNIDEPDEAIGADQLVVTDEIAAPNGLPSSSASAANNAHHSESEKVLQNTYMREQIVELQRTIEQMRLSMQRQIEGSSDAASSADSAQHVAETRKLQLRTAADASYFDSYSTSAIHEEMLRDRIRTEAYRDAIEKNADYVRGKVVMDVGCGSGILSLFCARAGARHVFAIEASAIARKARQIIADNQQQHVISVIEKRVEDVTEADVQINGQAVKVDIIVSEWMGYMLLFESMLPSVLLARNRFMAPRDLSTSCALQSLLLPNRANMYVAGASLAADRQKKRAFFRDCYGFNLSALLEERDMLYDDDLLDVPPSALVTDAQLFKAFDLMTIEAADLDFTTADVHLATQQNAASSSSAAQMDALVIWFDTPFAAPQLAHSVNLSTSPHTGATHWHQTVLYLQQPLELRSDDIVALHLTFRRAGHNQRAYKVDVTYCIQRAGTQRFVQTFTVD